MNSTTSRFHWTVDFSQLYSNALRVLRLRINNLEGLVLGKENRRGVRAGAFSFSLKEVGLKSGQNMERVGGWPCVVSSAR